MAEEEKPTLKDMKIDGQGELGPETRREMTFPKEIGDLMRELDRRFKEGTLDDETREKIEGDLAKLEADLKAAGKM